MAGGLIGGALVLGALAAGWPGPKPPLPPLLRDVSAGGGWWGACPPENPDDARMQEGGLALSPELNQRLSRSFPPGSSEMKMMKALRLQGFQLLSSPCKNDHSIHLARFTQVGGGMLVYPITAEVFWKVDPTGSIVWTKGFVMYLGL